MGSLMTPAKNLFKRSINISNLLDKSSFFLFGPRGTGKSFLIRETFPPKTLYLNLLKTSLQMRLQGSPSELEEIIDGHGPAVEVVIIDEVQKIPLLLDEVHRLIEERRIRFLLTGSSARRLKTGHANLLAGRARIANLFPITTHEITLPHFNLERYLMYGGLPAALQSDEPAEFLDAYVQSYINEEIKGESVVRRIPAFVDFLRVAALSSGKIINFANIARDVGVTAPTVASYYEILEDTLIGFQVPPWKRPTSRKSIATAKFYFFDTGVVNMLNGTESIDRNSDIFGNLFEQWIAMELRAYLSYRRTRKNLFFWRTEDQLEVDFVIEDEFAVEVKSSKKITAKDLTGLRVLAEEKLLKHLIIVSNDPIDRMAEGILILHWKTFIKKLWADDFLT
ncbi:MAG: ATP-binding protein [Proteobacteria bacterium]|nr:ATP-binding protein [Pseudomonadota bacterium]